MPFRLRTDARKWFRNLDRQLGSAPMFDMYYFCFLAGIAATRLETGLKDAETHELLDAFPGDYASKGRLLIGLLISRELKRSRISLEDRAALNECIAGLVDPDSPSRLSGEGMRRMNEYAHGGYEILCEWLGGGGPQELETFLPRFHERVTAALG